MPLPGWVNYGEAERSAAVMAREMSGASASWAELLAHAQAVLAHRTDTRDSEYVSTYDFDQWRDLVSAARILDLASTEKGFRDPQARRASAILSACAFGMSGTSVSGKAVIDSHDLLGTDLSDGELTALALSCPAISRETFDRLRHGTPHRSCVESVVAYLATGSREHLVAAQEVVGASYRGGNIPHGNQLYCGSAASVWRIWDDLLQLTYWGSLTTSYLLVTSVA